MNIMTKRILRWSIGIFALALLVFYYPQVSSWLNVENVRSFIDQFGALAPLAFITLYVIAGLFFLPLTIFSIAGGVLFGALWGTIIVLTSATLVGAFAFLIARQFSHLIPQAKAGIIFKLQDTVEKRLEKSTFQSIMILRLLYMPYIALSYAAGLVKTAQFWPFVGATFLTNIIGSFVFVYLGDQIDKGLAALAIPVVLIGLTLLIPKITKWFLKK